VECREEVGEFNGELSGEAPTPLGLVCEFMLPNELLVCKVGGACADSVFVVEAATEGSSKRGETAEGACSADSALGSLAETARLRAAFFGEFAAGAGRICSLVVSRGEWTLAGSEGDEPETVAGEEEELPGAAFSFSRDGCVFIGPDSPEPFKGLLSTACAPPRATTSPTGSSRVSSLDWPPSPTTNFFLDLPFFSEAPEMSGGRVAINM
jgi:hypothetical protein